MILATTASARPKRSTIDIEGRLRGGIPGTCGLDDLLGGKRRPAHWKVALEAAPRDPGFEEALEPHQQAGPGYSSGFSQGEKRVAQLGGDTAHALHEPPANHQSAAASCAEDDREDAFLALLLHRPAPRKAPGNWRRWPCARACRALFPNRP